MSGSIDSIISSWPKWPELKQDHPDFFDFLRTTKLLFTMRGFENTPELEPSSIPFQYDDDGHPMLQKEGVWVRFEQIKNLQLTYRSGARLLIDQQGQEWNYLPQSGLTPIERYNHIYSIGCLKRAALRALDHSVPKKANEQNCNHYIQIITIGKNLARRGTDHVGLRLIDQAGKVYSISCETMALNTSCLGFFKILSTCNARVSSQDFTEFKRFTQRHTTTVALSEEQFNAALAKVQELSRRPLRFDQIRQNCVLFIYEVMKAAGVQILTHQYPMQFALDVISSLIKKTKIGNLAQRIFGFLCTLVPSVIKTYLRWSFSALTYIPIKIIIVFRNFLLIALGATKEAEKPSIIPDREYPQLKELGNFRVLMPHWWKDIWQDEIGLIASPLAIAKWQDETMKAHTYTHIYTGSPKLTIVPPRPQILIERS